MSRLTDAQQDAVTAQVNANIEGRVPRTDPQTWYAIRQGLTADDADERQRWASKNLVQFMGRLSAEDFARWRSCRRSCAATTAAPSRLRLQIITRIANSALRSVGIDPTPRRDAAPDRDATKAARVPPRAARRAVGVRGQSRRPTEAEVYAIVNGLKDTGIKSGWLKVSDPGSSAGRGVR